MSSISFRAVLVSAHSRAPLPDMESFRESMPPWLRPLLVGPTYADMNTVGGGDFNGRVHYAFLSEGSKNGWPEAVEAQEWREKFAGLFADIPYTEVVHVEYGADHRAERGTPEVKYLAPVRDWE